MRKDLPAETRRPRSKTFFVNYGKGSNAARRRKTCSRLTYQGFRGLGMTRSSCRSARSNWPGKRTKIETDATLDAADKEKQLADVSRRLADLDKIASSARKPYRKTEARPPPVLPPLAPSSPHQPFVSASTFYWTAIMSLTAESVTCRRCRPGASSVGPPRTSLAVMLISGHVLLAMLAASWKGADARPLRP